MPTPADRHQEAALRDVRAAMGHDELELWYQPKVAIATGHVVGVEALLRWRHPTRGILPPAEVIAVAELDGQLLDDVTMTVVRAAGEASARWAAARLHLPVAINSAPATFRRRDIVDLVTTALDETGVSPEMLTLEMTESALMSAADDVIATVEELRRRGVAISMDDFGTGHSSLQRITELPLDELKIDRSFVTAMQSDPRVRRVVELIIDLAKDLGAVVTAEGVETPAQLSQLAELGCDAVQGYLVARPMPEQNLVRWLDEHTSATRDQPTADTFVRRVDHWPNL